MQGVASASVVAGGDPRHEQQQQQQCHAAVLGKRKERVVNSATSLANQYGVPVTVFSPGVVGLCWPPSKSEAKAIATRYNALPKKHQTTQSVHTASHLEDLQAAAKLAKGEAVGGGLFGDMPEDEIRVLLRSIDESVAAASDRIRKLQPKNIEEIDQELMLKYADKFMVETQDDVDAAAAVAAAEKEEARLRRQAIAKKPKPPAYTRVEDRNGVRYYKDGIEYVNLGGDMIERDTFESVLSQHSMDTTPVISLEPELLDDEDFDFDCYGYLLVPAHLWPYFAIPVLNDLHFG